MSAEFDATVQRLHDLIDSHQYVEALAVLGQVRLMEAALKEHVPGTGKCLVCQDRVPERSRCKTCGKTRRYHTFSHPHRHVSLERCQGFVAR